MALRGPEKEKAYPVVERGVIRLPKEAKSKVKDLVEKLEKQEVQLPKTITDDQGQPLVSPAQPQQVTVEVPLTPEETKTSLGVKVSHSIRWLAESIKRLVKKTGGKFVYRWKS